jgi:hypothetical protein
VVELQDWMLGQSAADRFAAQEQAVAGRSGADAQPKGKPGDGSRSLDRKLLQNGGMDVT